MPPATNLAHSSAGGPEQRHERWHRSVVYYCLYLVATSSSHVGYGPGRQTLHLSFVAAEQLCQQRQGTTVEGSLGLDLCWWDDCQGVWFENVAADRSEA